MIQNDAVIFGILMLILAFVFYTSNIQKSFFKNFYSIVPPLLLCYFLPGILNSFGVFAGENSEIYDISSNYFLPACLLLFIINLDIKSLWSMRKNVGLMFFTGMFGIIIGGPLAVWIVSLISPSTVEGETWRGLATLAGSWIGGGANQAALYTIFKPSAEVFSASLAVDVFVAYTWMAILIYGASKSKAINKFFNADNVEVEKLILNSNKAQNSEHSPKLEMNEKNLFILFGITFGIISTAHFLSAEISEFIEDHAPQLANFSLTSNFFWLMLITTIGGIALSFTKVSKYEKIGASKFATVFLYILIASIGMQMDIFAILKNPSLFLVGIIWITFHGLLLMIVAKIFKVPFFFFAIGSMSNVGGVASASATAAAFHPSLISVAVVTAVFSYSIGTYTGYICSLLLQWVAK